MSPSAPSPRDRVCAQVAHRETDAVPYVLGMDDVVAAELDAHYGTDAWRGLLQNGIVQVVDTRLGVGDPSTIGETTVRDVYGSLWRIDRRPFHLVEPALREPNLAGYRFPEIGACLTPGWDARARVRIAAQPRTYTVAGFWFGLFERTWALRGFDQALMDAAGDPGFYESLVAAVAEHQMAIVDCLLLLPVDGIMFSDDWGYQDGVLLGPDRWRRFIKPWLARMYERVHAAGKVCLSHCCGSIVEILPDIIDVGLDVIESVQPEARGMDPYALKREFGHHIAFWGGLGSQSVIPFGTPEGIRAEVGRLADEMARGGGYILGPAKALQPETPPANAAAVLESFLAEDGVRWPA